MRFTQAINKRRSTSVADRLRTEKSEKDPSKSKAQVQADKAKAASDAAKKRAEQARINLQLAPKNEKEKARKKVKDKAITAAIADRYEKQSKAIAEGKADRYYGGRAKGGLMEKEVKQPKKMRSGGLASKN